MSNLKKDLSDLTSQLVKLTVEAALNSEREEHLPRDHNGQFELQFVKKGQTRLTSFDNRFLDAIGTVFPKAQVQLCIVHMVRNSLRYVSWKERETVAADLKAIYQSVTVEEAELELDRFAEKWDDRFPYISKSWRNNWTNLIPLFNYPQDIRKAIYTTNAIGKILQTERSFQVMNLPLRLFISPLRPHQKNGRCQFTTGKML